MKLHILITSIVFLAAITGTHAAAYIQPNESKELFKVEKIPLQVDSMKELSRHLTTLAQRNQDSSPIQRRCTAQLLALAMRLNSANQQARETDQAILKNKSITAPEKNILRAKTRLEFFHRWLANSEAGKDANTLALYITDATRALNNNTLNNADQANWTGVLPPLNQYQEAPQITKKEDPPAPIPKQSTATLADNYKIPNLTVRMPLTMDTWTKSKEPHEVSQNPLIKKTTQSIQPVKLTITPQEQALSISVKTPLSSGNEENNPRSLKYALKLLETRLNEEPTNRGAAVNLKIGTPSKPSTRQYYSSTNGSSAATAVELMLAASKAGKKLRKDIHLCATLSKNGKLRLPKNTWEVLKALRKDNEKTGRLIVPKAAVDILKELLVFNEPDFFIRWEVIGVDRIDQALSYAVIDSKLQIKKAGELFSPIRKLTNNTAATLAVNKEVRKRLSEILTLAPEHLSAKMLLFQGSGRRSMHLSKLGTAYQIQPTIKAIRKNLANFPNAKTIKNTYEKALAELKAIERLVLIREAPFYQKSLELTNDLRSLSILINRNRRHGSNTNMSKEKNLRLSINKRFLQLEKDINLIITQHRLTPQSSK